jgi:hypothetical protein
VKNGDASSQNIADLKLPAFSLASSSAVNVRELTGVGSSPCGPFVPVTVKSMTFLPPPEDSDALADALADPAGALAEPTGAAEDVVPVDPLDDVDDFDPVLQAANVRLKPTAAVRAILPLNVYSLSVRWRADRRRRA